MLLLLFIVGLETDIKKLWRSGKDAARVAVAGVVLPVALGLAALTWLVDLQFTRALFMAAALSATSIGITARVLRDKGQLDSPSGNIILGAAVLDDVLGILLLTLLGGLVASGSFSPISLLGLLFKISCFGLAIALFRAYGVKRILRRVRPLEVSGTVTTFLISACLLSAALAEAVGGAGIIGAFALGVALDDVHFKGYQETESLTLEQLMKPVTDFLVPIFFIVMGMGVKLKFFADPSALLLGAVLVLCGVAGKLATGWVLSRSATRRGADPWLVGLGMIPRGEVGLLFAAIGLQQGALTPSDYAGVVAMVALTTLLAPFALSWRLTSGGKQDDPA